MATYYVSMFGSDSNNGTTEALAKLTLSGVNGVASAGDTILCHGIFKEAIPVSKKLYWVGVGLCVFDANAGGTVTPADGTTFTNIEFTNSSGHNITGATSRNYGFYGCKFRNTVGGFSYQHDWTISAVFDNCQFYDCSGSGIKIASSTSGGSGTSTILARNCVFIGNGKDVDSLSTGISGVITTLRLNQCCLGSSVMIQIANSTLANIINAQTDWNAFDFTNGKCVINSVDKTTLSAWQSSEGSPRDVNSTARVWRQSSDTCDYANRLLRPVPNSPLLTLGPSSTPVGLSYPAVGISNNCNASSGWTSNGTFSNTAIDGSGFLVLSSPGTGTWTSAVLDLGANISLTLTDIIVTGEVYPTTYIDYDTGDSPGHLTVEMRCDTSSFAAGAGSPSWVAVPRNAFTNLYISPVSARYWQIRLTLRG